MGRSCPVAGVGMLKYIRNQWDRVGAWICVAAGSLALLLGYLGVSGTLETAEQMPYVVSGGMTGLFLLGLGALLWISADLRDEWRKLDAIERHMAETDSVSGPEGGVERSDDAVQPAKAGTVTRRQVSLR